MSVVRKYTNECSLATRHGLTVATAATGGRPPQSLASEPGAFPATPEATYAPGVKTLPSVPLGVYRDSEGRNVQLIAVAQHVRGELLAVYIRLDATNTGEVACVAEPLDDFLAEGRTPSGSEVRFEFLGTAPPG